MKIMIRATNWVGDAIMALPALHAVRNRFPDAKISIVARPFVCDLYREQRICDELIDYDTKGLHKGWRGREKAAGGNCVPGSSMPHCSCKTHSMLRGWPGARAFPSASAMCATAAVCCSPMRSP